MERYHEEFLMNRIQINLLRQCLSKISNSEELNDEMSEPRGGWDSNAFRLVSSLFLVPDLTYALNAFWKEAMNEIDCDWYQKEFSMQMRMARYC